MAGGQNAGGGGRMQTGDNQTVCFVQAGTKPQADGGRCEDRVDQDTALKQLKDFLKLVKGRIKRLVVFLILR